MAAIQTAGDRIKNHDFDDETARILFGKEPQDEIDWIETYLTIEDPQGQVVDFNLFPQQRMMAENATGRDITVKGRQTRASSFILARNLRRMTNSEGLKCLIMTQDDQTTATFRARIKHHLRDLAQHGMEYKLGLDNDDELVIEDTNCRYIFGSGQESTAGRAYTASIVHLSELTHWPQHNVSSLLGAILPSVPGPPYGWFDIESTPNGADDEFHGLITSSKTYDEQSRWTTHFYPWWYEPRYRAGTLPSCNLIYSEPVWEKLLSQFQPTAEEDKLMKECQLDVGQILWRRVTKKEQDKTDAPFLQEYPETLEGCFLTTGGNYFASQDGINHLEPYRHTISPAKVIKETIPFRGGNPKFNGPNFHVWQEPQAGQPYVVWVDCAGGGLDDKSDFSAVIVLNAITMFEAARLNIKVAPQELAPMVVAIAEYYNTALLGGERDAFGLACLFDIQKLRYRNLWYFIEPGAQLKIEKAIVEPWGHPTQIRNLILTALREKVFNGMFHTSDALLLQQMGSFTWLKSTTKRDTMKAQGKRGQKDDLVMSAAGAVYIANLAAGKYNALQNTAGVIQENEVVFVDKSGVVQGRRGRTPASVKPWLR